MKSGNITRSFRILALSAGLAGLCGQVFADMSEISSLESKDGLIVARLLQQDREISTISRRLDKVSERIALLKGEQKRDPGMLKGFRLESNLKDARQIADELEEAKTLRVTMERELRDVRLLLAAKIDGQISIRRAELSESGLSAESRKTSAVELDKLLNKRFQLASSAKTTPIPSGTLRWEDRTVGPDEATERLNALRDFERRLLKESETISVEIAQLRRQRFVRNEVAHLLEEESFFSEQSFVRTGAQKTVKVDSALTSTKPPTGDAANTVAATSPPASTGSTATTTVAPSASTGSTATTTVAPSTSTGSTATTTVAPSTSTGSTATTTVASSTSTASSGSTATTTTASMASTGSSAAPILSSLPAGSIPPTTGASTSSLTTSSSTGSTAPSPTKNIQTGVADSASSDSSSDRPTRDPLMQLASELGVVPRDLQGLAASYKGVSGEGKIEWLEIRLKTTRAILKRLQEMARTIEPPLNK